MIIQLGKRMSSKKPVPAKKSVPAKKKTVTKTPKADPKKSPNLKGPTKLPSMKITSLLGHQFAEAGVDARVAPEKAAARKAPAEQYRMLRAQARPAAKDAAGAKAASEKAADKEAADKAAAFAKANAEEYRLFTCLIRLSQVVQ